MSGKKTESTLQEVIRLISKMSDEQCIGRCLPLYFGQDFAREQRIGNPAALYSGACSSTSWWITRSSRSSTTS